MTQPDLFVVNSMDASSHAVLQPTAAAISLRNDGRVTVTSSSRFKFSCPLDLKWALFDAHNCSISIGTMSPSTRLTTCPASRWRSVPSAHRRGTGHAVCTAGRSRI
jgi:hypothetical protein